MFSQRQSSEQETLFRLTTILYSIFNDFSIDIIYKSRLIFIFLESEKRLSSRIKKKTIVFLSRLDILNEYATLYANET